MRGGRAAFPLRAVALLLALSPAILAPSAVAAEKKTIIGRLEKAWVEEAGVTLTAKIDTGTRTSSLGVSDVHLFRRGGRDRVRFTVTDDGGKAATLDRPLFRIARFKENARGAEERPVVLLHLCIADIWRLTQVNLDDREGFDYPLLIGRRFLFGHALVNVGRQFTAQPHCAEMGESAGGKR